MFNVSLITPLQRRELEKELKLYDVKIELARKELQEIKESEQARIANNKINTAEEAIHYLSKLVSEKEYIKTVLDYSFTVVPEDNNYIQPGSRVELADTGRVIDLVFQNYSCNSEYTFVSQEAPIFDALIGKQAGDIVEYKMPNGNTKICVVGNVDNKYNSMVAEEEGYMVQVLENKHVKVMR